MGLAYTKESAYAQERVKWEGQHSEFGPPGRPFQYAEYPKRMSRAKDAQGTAFDAIDVADETEEQNMYSRGYRVGRDTAIEALLAGQKEVAEAAANRAYHEQRMTAKARAEAEAIDNATANHLPVIPEKPRRGRKPKTVEVSHG